MLSSDKQIEEGGLRQQNNSKLYTDFDVIFKGVVIFYYFLIFYLELIYSSLVPLGVLQKNFKSIHISVFSLMGVLGALQVWMYSGYRCLHTLFKCHFFAM